MVLIGDCLPFRTVVYRLALAPQYGPLSR